MTKHENPNIEIINKNLWAVQFSLIAYIPQISYKPDPSVPLGDIPAELFPEGIILLNKDFKFYQKFRNSFAALMKLKPRQLKSELAKFAPIPANTVNHVIYLYCLQAETMRRKTGKVVKPNGNNQNSGSTV